MSRVAMLAGLVACCGLLSGCCTVPYGHGGNCGTGPAVGYGGCTDGCGGCGPGWNHRPVARGPLESVHLMRKRLLCGAGCGETYFGEWRSHPPDCADPCCFDYTYNQRDGRADCGACGTCDYCCFSPPPRPSYRPVLNLLGRIYGERFCEGCDLYGTGECNDCNQAGGDWHDHSVGTGCETGGCGDSYATARGTYQNRVAKQVSSIPEPRRVAQQPTSGRQR